MRVAVEGGGYRQACDAFYTANRLLTDSMLSFSSSLSGTGRMAGDDSGGTDWAASYDPAAQDALQAGEDLVRSFATMANLLNASLVNHEGAEGGARLYGPPMGGSGSDGDPDPDHSTSTVGLATPPSAAGGTGDEPSWWGLIADEVGGLLWPDADTGRLREAGDRWRTQAQSISSMESYCETAASMIGTQTSPEIADAVAACNELKGHVADIATAYQDLGDVCDDYAQQVDDHRDQVLDELTSFIAWSAGIQIVGGVATFFTVGLAQVPTQAAQAGKIAAAAFKVRKILTALLAVAKTATTVVRAIGTKIAGIVAKLAKFLGPKARRAVVKAGSASRGALSSAEKEGLEWATKNAQKMDHIFAGKHKFGPLVEKLGSREAVVERMLVAIRSDLPAAGKFQITTVIEGQTVVVRGFVGPGGVPKIGTAFTP